MRFISIALLPLLLFISSCTMAGIDEGDRPFIKFNSDFVHESAYGKSPLVTETYENEALGVRVLIHDVPVLVSKIEGDLEQCEVWSEFLFIINVAYEKNEATVEQALHFNREILSKTKVEPVFYNDHLGFMNSERLIRDFYRMISYQTLKQQQIRAFIWCMEDENYWVQ